MGKEIEHKYLVNDDSFIALATSCFDIKQGYICREKYHTVRIRIKGDEAFLTIKGITTGDTRPEFEYPIPIQDAQILLDTLCCKPIIEKKRYIIDYHGNKWEVDVFGGGLAGLVVAEIEIPTSDYKYDIPPFIGKNVTDNPHYYNANLIDGMPTKQ